MTLDKACILGPSVKRVKESSLASSQCAWLTQVSPECACVPPILATAWGTRTITAPSLNGGADALRGSVSDGEKQKGGLPVGLGWEQRALVPPEDTDREAGK